MQELSSSQVRKLTALIARSGSVDIQEARTSSYLAIQYMKKYGILSKIETMLRAIELHTKSKKPKAKPRRARTERQQFAKSGGKTRAAALTPEQRSEIAKKAVQTRWKNQRKLLKK